jgi:hypothetical protein
VSPRNRASARDGAARLERSQADYLAKHKCKDVARWEPAKWLREADIERGNDDALAGMVIAKRRGVGYTNPGDQLVLMTVRDLVALLTGSRPDEDEAVEGGAA